MAFSIALLSDAFVLSEKVEGCRFAIVDRFEWNHN